MASRIILVTGANQGIGFELVRQLAQKGHTVYLGARSVEKGKEAVAKLHAEKLNTVHFLQLEVTEQASVDAAAKEFASKHDHLDILINNAGIAPEGFDSSPVDLKFKEIKDTFEVNFFGVLRVIKAFTPFVVKSSNPVILNVSSSLGSLARQTGPNKSVQLPGYNPSKSALNMYTITLASALPNVRVNVICPGYTATAMNGYSGHLTTQQSAEGVIKYGVLLEKDGPTSTYLSYDGNTYPW